MSVITIYDLDVIFPYKKVYPEQRNYMGQLKLSYDNSGSCVLEMPAGTEKAVAFFAVTLAYMEAHPEIGPLVVCLNSLPAINRAIESLKVVHQKRLEKSDSEFNRTLLSVPFFSKSTACLNQNVIKNEDIPMACMKITLPWSDEMCPFFERKIAELPAGIMNAVEFKRYCSEQEECPYFAARRLVDAARVIFCCPQDLVHPRDGEFLRSKLPPDSIIIMGDATTLDDICCESVSYYLTPAILDKANDAVKNMKQVLDRAREVEQDLLQQSLDRLRQNMRLEELTEMAPETTNMFRHPVPVQHRSKRALPGSLRNSDVLLSRIQNLVSFFRRYFKEMPTIQQTPSDLLTLIKTKVFMDPEMLHFMSSRFAYFFMTHRLLGVDKCLPLWAVLDFAAVLSTYEEGVGIFFDSKAKDTTDASSHGVKFLQLACFDATYAFDQLSHIKRIVVTGESISPVQMYSQLLGIEPAAMVGQTLACPIRRRNFYPMIVSRATDQTDLTSLPELGENSRGISNYGRAIVELARIVPDGILGFFPSFHFLQEILGFWNATGVLKNILQHKLLFIEPQNPREAALVLDDYMRACDTGRGAVLFAVATGRYADGVDFSGRYCRACVIFGMPEPQKRIGVSRQGSEESKKNPVVYSRAEYLDIKYQIPRGDFVLFNQVRHATKCVSNILSSKKDYALALFADVRYRKLNVRRDLMSPWISSLILENQVNMSVDEALEDAGKFFPQIAQEVPLDDEEKVKYIEPISE